MAKSKKVSHRVSTPSAAPKPVEGVPNRSKALRETLEVIKPNTKKAFHPLLQWFGNQPAEMTLTSVFSKAEFIKLISTTSKPGGLRKDGQWTWLCCWYYGIYLPAWLFAAKRASANGHNSMCAAGQLEWNVGYAKSKKLREAAEAKAKEERAELEKESMSDSFTVPQYRKGLARIEKDLAARVERADDALRNFNLFTQDSFTNSVAYAATKWATSIHEDNRQKAKTAKNADLSAVWKSILALPENQPLIAEKGLKLPEDIL